MQANTVVLQKDFLFPQTGFVRLDQVLGVFPVSKSKWWAGIKAGEYPKGIKHGGVTFWKAEDIHTLIQSVSDGE